MENYKVLLVDDEEEIRGGIIAGTDWQSMGLTLAGQAGNGIDALDVADAVSPDIVITDIKMPFMDGLELCKILRTRLPATKFVVISGFDEFSYAQQAIGMGVSRYVLKPINSAEFCRMLTVIRGELDEERQKQRDIELLRDMYDESLPILRQMYFTQLLDGQLDCERICALAEKYEISLPGEYRAVCFITREQNVTDSYDDALLLSLKSLFEQQFGLKSEAHHIFLYKNMLAVLCCFSSEKHVYRLIKELNRMSKLALSLLGMGFSSGVGHPHKENENISLCAKQAMSALEYRALSRDSVIYLGDIEPAGEVYTAFDEDDEKMLVNAIKFGATEDIDLCISKLGEKIEQLGRDITQYRIFLVEVTACVLKLARAATLSDEEVFGDNFDDVFALTRLPSLHSVKARLREGFVRLNEHLHTHRKDTNWRLIEQAKRYIEEKYSDPDLNVEALCAVLNLSQTYFSTVFKRETGTSFTSHVTKIRMKHATRLLKESNDKTYIIAEKTGYLDPNYFSFVFKKEFGVSPTKYRSEQH